MDLETKKLLQQLHHKGLASYRRTLIYVGLYFILAGLSIWLYRLQLYWPILLVWAVQSHLGHMNLIAFHEASHYILHPQRLLNEANGILVGTFILTPLSSYRLVHNAHHLRLGEERDLELWPYVNTAVPRWQRLLSAAGELLLGFFYTPVVFLHGVLNAGRLPASLRRRLWGEYALCLILWTGLIGGATYFGLVPELLIAYVIPSIISGNLQSLRKFTEHMGMLGDDVPSLTRTVVPNGPIGRFLSWTMMHIDYHGTHHRFAKIPQYNLPKATTLVYEDALHSQRSIYPTYLSAMWAMFRTLADPRVGAQWRGMDHRARVDSESSTPASEPAPYRRELLSI